MTLATWSSCNGYRKALLQDPLNSLPNFSSRWVRMGKGEHYIYALFNLSEYVFFCNKGKCIPFPAVLVVINKNTDQSDPERQRRPPFSHYGRYVCAQGWGTKRRVYTGEAPAQTSCPPSARTGTRLSLRASSETWQRNGGWDMTWDRAWHTAKVQ